MLLLRIRFVQARQGEQDGPSRFCAADCFEVSLHIFQGVIHHFDGCQDDMSLFIELRDVLGGIVTGFIEAAQYRGRSAAAWAVGKS